MRSIKVKIFRPICDRRIDLWWIIASNLFYNVLIEEVEKRTNIELDGLNLRLVVDYYDLMGFVIEENELLTCNA